MLCSDMRSLQRCRREASSLRADEAPHPRDLERTRYTRLARERRRHLGDLLQGVNDERMEAGSQPGPPHGSHLRRRRRQPPYLRDRHAGRSSSRQLPMAPLGGKKAGVRVGSARSRTTEGRESRRAGGAVDAEEGTAADRLPTADWRRRLRRVMRLLHSSDSLTTVRTVLAAAIVLCTLLSVHTVTSLVRPSRSPVSHANHKDRWSMRRPKQRASKTQPWHDGQRPGSCVCQSSHVAGKSIYRVSTELPPS